MGKIKQLLGASILLIFASSANAMLIVLEPDDFAYDEPILSPYVHVTGQYSCSDDCTIIDPLFPRFTLDAATGVKDFGHWGTEGQSHIDDSAGLRFDFMQAVTNVSLLAYIGGPLPFDLVVYNLYDSTGSFILRGRVFTEGEISRVNIPDTPRMVSLVIGGPEDSAIYAFDHLKFTVPAPAAIWLFGTGLLGLIGFSKRKKSA